MNTKLIINRKMTKRIARKMYNAGESPIGLVGKRFDFNGEVWVYAESLYDKSRGEEFTLTARRLT